MSYTTISIEKLNRMIEAGEPVEMIDVRTPAEFQSLHIRGTRNLPLATLDPKLVMQTRRCDSNHPLYIVCKSGSRSEMACRQFTEHGFSNVVSVSGGTMRWAAEGLPVNRGKRKVISVDRQMRIVAGSLALLGVVLGFYNSAYFYLSGFIGAGLIFAGITDKCPMMKALSMMPWNQASDCDSCTSE